MNGKFYCHLLFALLFVTQAQAGDVSFAALLEQGEHAEKHSDVLAAAQYYSQAEQVGHNNDADLCVLTRKYCDLMHLADTIGARQNLLAQAMACAQRAVKISPKSSTAHASLAVCYAKACAFAGVKGEVADSRLFKQEAEIAISLNPHEDVAYYLLGRWNYGVANIDLLSRAYLKIIYGGFPHASNEEAIKNFKQAIAIAPGHAIYYIGLANVYETTGQKDLALIELKNCVQLKPLDYDDQMAQEDALRKLNSLSH